MVYGLNDAKCVGAEERSIKVMPQDSARGGDNKELGRPLWNPPPEATTAQVVTDQAKVQKPTENKWESTNKKAAFFMVPFSRKIATPTIWDAEVNLMERPYQDEQSGAKAAAFFDRSNIERLMTPPPPFHTAFYMLPFTRNITTPTGREHG